MDDIIAMNTLTRNMDSSQNNSINNTYVNEAAEVLTNPEMHEQSVIEIEFFRYMYVIYVPLLTT
jgi:hypothetical protein